MSDSFYHITESIELNQENKGPKHTHLAMFWKFCVGWLHDVSIYVYSAIYDVMKSYLTRAWDQKICNGYITRVHKKQEFLCDKGKSEEQT